MAFMTPIVAGFLGLAYGSSSSFSDTQQTLKAKPGPIESSVTDKEKAKFPARAGWA